MAFGYIYITRKQQEILLLIYKFRFLNRIQIQTLLRHKDPKRINAWLKDLTEKKYLGRIYVRKLPENIKPAIYYAAVNGVHFFRQQDECNKILLPRLRKEQYHSIRFRNHCLFLAQIYIDLLKTKSSVFTLESFETKVNLIDYEEMITPFPDAFVTFKKPISKGKQTKKYFLEIIDEGTPRYYLRYRIKAYLDYFEDHSPITKVLVVCPNELTVKFLEKFIPKILDEEYYGNKTGFSLALSEDVRGKSLLSDIWRTISA